MDKESNSKASKREMIRCCRHWKDLPGLGRPWIPRRYLQNPALNDSVAGPPMGGTTRLQRLSISLDKFSRKQFRGKICSIRPEIARKTGVNLVLLPTGHKTVVFLGCCPSMSVAALQCQFLLHYSSLNNQRNIMSVSGNCHYAPK